MKFCWIIAEVHFIFWSVLDIQICAIALTELQKNLDADIKISFLLSSFCFFRNILCICAFCSAYCILNGKVSLSVIINWERSLHYIIPAYYVWVGFLIFWVIVFNNNTEINVPVHTSSTANNTSLKRTQPSYLVIPYDLSCGHASGNSDANCLLELHVENYVSRYRLRENIKQNVLTYRNLMPLSFRSPIFNSLTPHSECFHLC